MKMYDMSFIKHALWKLEIYKTKLMLRCREERTGIYGISGEKGTMD